MKVNSILFCTFIVFLLLLSGCGYRLELVHPDKQPTEVERPAQLQDSTPATQGNSNNDEPAEGTEDLSDVFSDSDSNPPILPPS